MKTYNKLVRDKIPGIIKAKGQEVIFHVAKEDEYGQKLKEKLAEEVIEFFREETAEEMADVVEVLEALQKFLKISSTKLQTVRAKKKKERGGFSKRIILEKS